MAESSRWASITLMALYQPDHTSGEDQELGDESARPVAWVAVGLGVLGVLLLSRTARRA